MCFVKAMEEKKDVWLCKSNKLHLTNHHGVHKLRRKNDINKIPLPGLMRVHLFKITKTQFVLVSQLKFKI